MIKVENVCKQFGFKHVLCGVNLEIPDGKTLVVMGASGVGKSILLKTIYGLIKPDQGTINIDGVNITECPSRRLQEIQKKIGYVFQESALFDSLDVFDNVAFGLRTLTLLNENEINQRVAECLSMVGLGNIEHLKPAELSGGMKKRVGIARAVAYRPHYIFYDEPTTGLDPITSDLISDLIINLRECLNVTSIVITHDLRSMYKIVDIISMLHKGKIVFSGKPEEVKHTKNEYVKQFVDGFRPPAGKGG